MKQVWEIVWRLLTSLTPPHSAFACPKSAAPYAAEVVRSVILFFVNYVVKLVFSIE